MRIMDRIEQSKRGSTASSEGTWEKKVEAARRPDAIDHPGVKQALSYFGPKSVLHKSAIRHNYVLVDLLMALGHEQPPLNRNGLGGLLREYAERPTGIQRRDVLIRLAAWALAGAHELDDEIRARREVDGLDPRPVR